jgi:hypothetical protein
MTRTAAGCSPFGVHDRDPCVGLAVGFVAVGRGSWFALAKYVGVLAGKSGHDDIVDVSVVEAPSAAATPS